MSFPTDGLNAGKLAGSQLLSLTDLQLPVALTSAQVIASTPFNTGIPATVVVLGRLSSGTSTTCKLAVAATSGVVYSATSATFVQGATNAGTINTATTTLWAGVQLTDTGSGSGFNQAGGILTAFVLYVQTIGENHNSTRTGYLGCSSTLIGDGSGVATLSPA